MKPVSAQVSDFRWSGRRVCVTGGAGFIGSWLVRDLLANGAYVVATKRPNGATSPILEALASTGLVLVETNLDDADVLGCMLGEHEIDTMFHLAANNYNTDFSTSALPIFESNIRTTYQVLDAFRQCAPRIERLIVASSREAARVDADDQPLHPYGASKRCAEIVVRAFAESYGLPLGIIRFDNVYGGGDLNFNRLVPSIIKSFIEGNVPVLRQGTALYRGYIHAEDFVAALKLSAAHIEPKAWRVHNYFFQADETVSAPDMVRRVASIMGKEYLMPIIANSTLEEHSHADWPGPADEYPVNWRPRVSLQEGLKTTVSWYEDYLFHRLPETRGG